MLKVLFVAGIFCLYTLALYATLTAIDTSPKTVSCMSEGGVLIEGKCLERD